MLTEVRVKNVARPNLAALTIPLFESGDYKLHFIEGLNPPPNTITTSEYAYLHGSKFQNTRAQSRNIVMTLGFSPQWATGKTYTQLRRGLYPYLSGGAHVELEFVTDQDTYVIRGYVETHESDIFVKEPVTQVSVLCPDPYFYSEEIVRVFPTASFDNFIDYEGDVPSGFLYQATVDAGGLDPGFGVGLEYETNISSTLWVDEYLITGDSIEFSTVPGNLFVRKTQPQSKSLLDSLEEDSEWPVLKPGRNTLKHYRTVWDDDVTITYREAYGGI